MPWRGVVGIYATAQIRSLFNTQAASSARERDWLDDKRGLLELCRQAKDQDCP